MNGDDIRAKIADKNKINPNSVRSAINYAIIAASIIGYFAVSFVSLDFDITAIVTMSFNAFFIIVVGVSTATLAVDQADINASLLEHVLEAEKKHKELVDEINQTEPEDIIVKTAIYNERALLVRKKEVCRHVYELKWDKYFTDEGYLKEFSIPQGKEGKELIKKLKGVLNTKVYALRYSELKSLYGRKEDRKIRRPYGQTKDEKVHAKKAGLTLKKVFIGVFGGMFVANAAITGSWVMALIQCVIFIAGAGTAYFSTYLFVSKNHPAVLYEKRALLQEIRGIRLNDFNLKEYGINERPQIINQKVDIVDKECT